jgi:hypothetical protein
MITNPTNELSDRTQRPAGGPVLPMSARVVLVGLDTVRAALGVDAENVLAKVESGELQFVFNLGTGNHRRQLRFYLPELTAPAAADLTLAKVIQNTLGTAAGVHRGELERRFCVSHVLIGRLIRHRHLALSAPGVVSRASLEKFLTARWVGSKGATP